MPCATKSTRRVPLFEIRPLFEFPATFKNRETVPYLILKGLGTAPPGSAARSLRGGPWVASPGASSATAEPEAPSVGAVAASVHTGGIALMASDRVPGLARSLPTAPTHLFGLRTTGKKRREIRGYFSTISVVSYFLLLFRSFRRSFSCARLTGWTGRAQQQLLLN